MESLVLITLSKHIILVSGSLDNVYINKQSKFNFTLGVLFGLSVSLVLSCLSGSSIVYATIENTGVLIYNVLAGSDNGTSVDNTFNPDVLMISVNDSVKWVNPVTGLKSPHTITFINENSTRLNMMLKNISESFNRLSPPWESETYMRSSSPNKKENTSSFPLSIIRPAVISSLSTEFDYLHSNNTFDPGTFGYTMNGDEKYVSSGFLWPQNQVPHDYPNVTSFTVKFEKAGTYFYKCLLHPETRGIVIAKEGIS